MLLPDESAHGQTLERHPSVLDDVRDRPNLTIMTEATVETLISEKRTMASPPLGYSSFTRARASRPLPTLKSFLRQGHRFATTVATVRYRRGECSAGTDIPVHHALPGVGQNLQDHLQIRTIYQVDNTVTLNQRARTPWGMAMMGLNILKQVRSPCHRLS